MLNDTPPTIDAIYEAMLRRRSGSERLQMASSMHATAKALALISLQEQHPHASDRELKGLLFLRFYTEDFPVEERSRIYEHLVNRPG